MKKIIFKEFNYDRISKKLSFFIQDELTQPFEVYFILNKVDFYLSSRFITMLVGSICGKKYDFIYIDYPIPNDFVSFLKDFTGSEISVEHSNEVVGLLNKQHKKYCLSFSGGFDSLAAYCLLKSKDFNCVSMDFGGKFKREKIFFENFDTNIIETNFLETKLQKNHWTFMGIGICIMSEMYDIDHYVFGGIIQNSFIKFTKNSKFKNQSIGMFPLSGMQALPVVQGLTEVGTIQVILNHFKIDDIMKSLFSLSNVGEFKLYRKYLLLCAIDFSFYNIDIMKSVFPTFKLDISLEKNQGELFLLLFILKNYKGSMYDIERGFIGIEQKIMDFIELNNLDFYKKANTEVYNALDSLEVEKSLFENNIEYYLDEDYNSFFKVTNFLSDFYS